MILSILHRMAGIVLSIGLVAFVMWLQAIAYDAVSYAAVAGFFASPVGKLLLLGWTLAFFFHLANGVRHLVWDSGRLLTKAQAERSSWVVITVAGALTAGYWLLV